MTDTAVTPSATTVNARQRWEYKVLNATANDSQAGSLERKLNQLGDDGWEMCGYEPGRTNGWVVLKRPALIVQIF